MTVNSFRDLLVWQKGMDLTTATYRVAKVLPKLEQNVLGYQLRKTSISIPSNIAEGASGGSNATYIHHLRIARASGCELETQLEIGARTEFFTATQIEPLLRQAQEIEKMLNGLIRALKKAAKRNAGSSAQN